MKYKEINKLSNDELKAKVNSLKKDLIFVSIIIILSIYFIFFNTLAFLVDAKTCISELGI